MDPRTGDVFDLDQIEDAKRAVKAMEAGEIERKLAEVEAAEIEHLQGLSRKERRKALRGRNKIDREELKRKLFNQQ